MHCIKIVRCWFYLLPIIGLSQIVDDVVILKYSIPCTGDFVRVMCEQKKEVLGTPYKNHKYEMGSVTTYSVKEDSLLLRYNAYRDQFEILNETQSTTYLQKGEDSQVELDGLQYTYQNFSAAGKVWSGYLNPLNAGRTLLYRRRIKTAEIEMPDNGYHKMQRPKFEDITEYFIKRVGRPTERLRGLSRKEVFAILWDKYSELRKYAKKNKLHMRVEEEVIRVLSYYDSLKNQKNGE